MSKENENLSIRQKKLIRALVDYQTPGEALESTGIAVSTYYRWMEEPDFIQALQTAQQRGISESYRRLIANRDQVVEVLENILETGTDEQRLRAGELYVALMDQFGKPIKTY